MLHEGDNIWKLSIFQNENQVLQTLDMPKATSYLSEILEQKVIWIQASLVIVQKVNNYKRK